MTTRWNKSKKLELERAQMTISAVKKRVRGGEGEQMSLGY
jgi:hypothetical protein